MSALWRRTKQARIQHEGTKKTGSSQKIPLLNLVRVLPCSFAAFVLHPCFSDLFSPAGPLALTTRNN
jgi:hypothetical protein